MVRIEDIKCEEEDELVYVEEEYLEDNTVGAEEEFVEYDDIIEEDPSHYDDHQVIIKRQRSDSDVIIIKSEESFTCRLCPNKMFSSRYRYRMHLKEEHPSRHENRFWVMTSAEGGPRETVCSKEMCTMCGKWITTSSLENHIKRMHSDDYQFFCDHCPQKFKVKRDIQYHVKKHMIQEYRERYQCEYCENSYLTMWALRHHFTMQHAEISKDFVCDCGAAFKTKLRLNYHRVSLDSKLWRFLGFLIYFLISRGVTLAKILYKICQCLTP